jgi:hypothetical protein
MTNGWVRNTSPSMKYTHTDTRMNDKVQSRESVENQKCVSKPIMCTAKILEQRPPVGTALFRTLPTGSPGLSVGLWSEFDNYVKIGY